VQIVAKNAKYHSSHRKADQFIAGTAGKSDKEKNRIFGFLLFIFYFLQKNYISIKK